MAAPGLMLGQAEVLEGWTNPPVWWGVLPRTTGHLSQLKRLVTFSPRHHSPVTCHLSCPILDMITCVNWSYLPGSDFTSPDWWTYFLLTVTHPLLGWLPHLVQVNRFDMSCDAVSLGAKACRVGIQPHWGGMCQVASHLAADDTMRLQIN